MVLMEQRMHETADKGNVDDQRVMSTFHYKQELRRTIRLFSSFAVAFSFISITTGIFANYELVLDGSGPVGIWAWPVVIVGQLFVALVFAELAARIPLTGYSYQWVTRLAGSGWGWFTGWAFARNCILARRLIERGVRFVQVFNGAYADGGRINWDGHFKLKEQYDVHGPILDQPVAGLLQDLQLRGLLESTLVLFCTEFGRMPMFQAGTYGRDHNPFGFAGWLAGAGVKTPFSFGATDEFGSRRSRMC